MQHHEVTCFNQNAIISKPSRHKDKKSCSNSFIESLLTIKSLEGVSPRKSQMDYCSPQRNWLIHKSTIMMSLRDLSCSCKRLEKKHVSFTASEDIRTTQEAIKYNWIKRKLDKFYKSVFSECSTQQV